VPTASAAPSREVQAAVGDQIAQVAQRYRDERPALSVAACNGLIEDVLRDAGLPLRGNVRTLFAEMEERGWLHDRRVPVPGDIVFFDNTYDSNRNGKQDDPLSHIAVVISVDDDGTVHMVHHGSKGIRPLILNLHQPGERRAPDGKVWNSWLGKPGYARDGQRLAGELWRVFASPGGAPAAVAIAPSDRSGRPSSVEPPALPMDLDDPVFERAWAGRRLRPRHLDGRSCRELWFLRNVAVARHGYAFANPQARAIFELIPAYTPNAALGQAAAWERLSRRDLANVDAMLERELRCR